MIFKILLVGLESVAEKIVNMEVVRENTPRIRVSHKRCLYMHKNADMVKDNLAFGKFIKYCRDGTILQLCTEST